MNPIRVMLADDDPDLRDALVELLSAESSLEIVGLAAETRRAVEIACEERPDVALLDVKMPGGGGAFAAQEIARCSPDTRVIALSAFEDRTTVLEMLRAGAAGYLVKGTSSEAIVEAIERVMKGQGSLSAEVVADVVQELSTQLVRESARSDELAAMRARIEQVLAGHGPTIVFQPIVDLIDRSLVGFEALSRFALRPQRPPDVWFAEAASVGLGVELELHAMRAAIAGAPSPAGRVYLSLNVSHRTVLSGLVREALGTYPLRRVVLEITEHERIDDYDRLDDALQELRAKGVRVAIDDAGAGFASLRHTLQLAPDIIKLDISITRDLHRDGGHRAMAAALRSFADEMGVSIIAEGVETPEQIEALKGLGVHVGQGFLLGRPTARPQPR